MVYNKITSGGDASRSKQHQHSIAFLIMQFAISGSSAIENIAVDDNTATITFAGGRAYDYTVNDVTAFVTALTDIMTKQESVGRFVNQQIKSETLQKVAA